MKYMSAPLAFTAAFLLFGTPSALATGLMPTVGGCAHAHNTSCDSYGMNYSQDPSSCHPEEDDGCQRAAALTIALSTTATIHGGVALFMTLIPGGQAAGIALGIWAVGLGVAAFAIGIAYADCGT